MRKSLVMKGFVVVILVLLVAGSSASNIDFIIHKIDTTTIGAESIGSDLEYNEEGTHNRNRDDLLFFDGFEEGASSCYEGNSVSNGPEVCEIRIAILAEEPIGWGSCKWTFGHLLNDYQWRVGDKLYRFTTTEIFDKEILRGDLNTNNYDLLLVPGAGVGDGESIVKGFPLRPLVKKWKSEIVAFIKSGGGYTGYCGGAALITELEKEPETFLERQYEKSNLGISCVKSYYKEVAMYILYPFQRWMPEKIGAGTYIWFHNDEESDGELDEVEDMAFWSGAPIDVVVHIDHPIFDDFLEETTRITWVGGAGLIVPDLPDRVVDILAQYPEDGISDNESTSITAWRYTGGVLGFLKGLIRGFEECRKNNEPLLSGFKYAYFFAGDWESTNRKIDLNFSDKPCITAEVYPNENKGRIVLTTPHPEYMVWWGGHIEPMPDTGENCLAEGLYTWRNITPPNETIEDEFRHAWWIIRRQVAWASQLVPDNDLPPVYGPSQVDDISPYDQPSIFSITGNAETSDGITSLQLYYRYSSNNVSFTNWTLYAIDTDESDGWSWEFNALNGTGYYQFYSIRCVQYESYSETENVPPGPDAIVRVV